MFQLDLSIAYESKCSSYYDIQRPEMLEFVPSHALRILEIGCGSGSFGRELKKRVPTRKVWGIEPNKTAANVAREYLDRVIANSFSPNIAELKGIAFDAVCLNDVLEHMANPNVFLEEIKSFLVPEGMIIASIPNILFFYQIWQILREEDWRYEDAGIMDFTHLRFFTKKSMIRMFESCGYEIVRIEGINESFGFKYWLLNTLLLGRLHDWRFVQFAVQARLKSKN